MRASRYLLYPTIQDAPLTQTVIPTLLPDKFRWHMPWVQPYPIRRRPPFYQAYIGLDQTIPGTLQDFIILHGRYDSTIEIEVEYSGTVDLHGRYRSDEDLH